MLSQEYALRFGQCLCRYLAWISVFILMEGCSGKKTYRELAKYQVDQRLINANSAGNLVINMHNFERERAIFFKHGSDLIDEKGSMLISGHARFMQAYPHLYLKIYAYADDYQQIEKNTYLSEARAKRIRRELLNSGISSTRIVETIARSYPREERSLNVRRRVDLGYFAKIK